MQDVEQDWRVAVRGGVTAIGIGFAIAVAGMVVLALVFTAGWALALPIVFFLGVAWFTSRIAREERAWRRTKV